MSDFITFLRHFAHILGLVWHVLAALLVLMLLGGGIVSLAEKIDFGEAIYLTFITALTVGYGDLAPATPVGRVVSVLIGLTGLIFFGVFVSVANRALSRLVEDNRRNRKASAQAQKQEAKQAARQEPGPP